MLWFKSNYGLKTFFERFFISGESMEPFTIWAFGDDYDTFTQATQFLDAWNQRHGDVLELGEDGTIAGDAEKMFEEYKKFLARVP